MPESHEMTPQVRTHHSRAMGNLKESRHKMQLQGICFKIDNIIYSPFMRSRITIQMP